MATNTSAPSPSEPHDTATDHRSLLNVVSWFLMIVAFLIVLTRCGTRWTVSHKFELDDGLIVLSLVLAICATATLTIGVSNGLGLLDWEKGSIKQIDALQKAVYSFNILFIASQSFAKASVALFIHLVMPDSRRRSLALFTVYGTVIWTITAVFSLLFQCHTPIWNFVQNTCVNRLGLYTYIEITSLVLDLCLILLPTIIGWRLRIEWKPKLIILGCFLTRILVIAAITVQLVILYRQNETGDPFLSWATIISTETIMSLSITSACIPYLKPFFHSVNSGMIGSDDIRRKGEGGTVHKYVSKSRKKISNIIGSRAENSVLGTRLEDDSFPHNLRGIPLESDPQVMTRNNVSVTANEDIVPADWEAGSQSSRANFIYQTSTFAVGSEYVKG